jgi:hypothetical protein
MPLVIAPLFALNSQYRPNKFVVSLTSANPIVLAYASIIVDLNGVTSISKQPFFSFGTTYYFEFDVAKVLQQSSQPKSQNKTTIFPDTLGIPYNVLNTDIHTTVALIVTYAYIDPVTGLLTPEGTVDVIPDGYPAIAGTRQTRDWQTMGMDFYIQTFGAGTPFLTIAPNPYEICNDENHYLTFIPAICNAVRVTTRDDAGVTIDSGMFTIIPNTDYVPTTIGVGMPNLLTQTYFTGAVDMTDPLIASYEVQVGQAFFFGSSWSFFPFSELRTFNVIDCCGDRRVRLHWMNRLGGIDAYTFTSKKTVSEKSKSTIGQKPLSFGYTYPPATSYDRGQYKIQTEAIKEYEVESTFYDLAAGVWIAELLTSPEVYMETSDGLIAVVVDDSSIKLEESDELLSLSVKFVESNYISVQSN